MCLQREGKATVYRDSEMRPSKGPTGRAGDASILRLRFQKRVAGLLILYNVCLTLPIVWESGLFA
jgi:hypothetical protein